MMDETAWIAAKRVIRLPDGRDLAFIDQGHGPTLLLLHGYTDSSWSFCLLADWLAGYRLIIPDLAGHGLSSAPNTFSLQGLVDDISYLVDALGCGSLTIIGHSMGSLVGMLMGAQPKGQVERLVLIGSATKVHFDAGFVAEISALTDPVGIEHRIFSTWHDCCSPPAAAFLGPLRQDAAKLPAAIWQGWLGALDGTDMAACVSGLRCPALSIGGVEDPLFAPSVRQGLMASPLTMDLIELEGHGHNPHWESPEKVAGLVKDFIAGTRLSGPDVDVRRASGF